MWVRALPGGPATALLGERATPARIAEVNRRLRARPAADRAVLDVHEPCRPARLRSVDRVAPRRSATRSRRFPATIELAIAAMIFAVGSGSRSGLLAAKRDALDGSTTRRRCSLIGVSIPVFFLAFILKYVFAVKLGWLPRSAGIDAAHEVEHSDELLHARRILAGDWRRSSTRSSTSSCPPSRSARSRWRSSPASPARPCSRCINEDYVRTAGAKGMLTRDVATGATCCATPCCR